MRRRDFIAAFGGVAAWPLAAWAQQPGGIRRVGVLMSVPEGDAEGPERLQAFRQGLADLGWVEGRNLRVDVRWAPDVARQQSLARELAALAPEAVLVTGTTATRALRDATRTIPIVFVGLSDPVATGVVSNLARPDANVTGFMSFEHSLAGKWLGLLKDMAPRFAHVALLFNQEAAVPFAPFYVRTAQEAGQRLALRITTAGVRDAAEIELAIAAVTGRDEGGLVVLPGGYTAANRATIIALAAKYRVPAIYNNRIFAVDGGLMSYGADRRLSYRDGASYVDRILRGTRPAELPVQFATKFELVINLKTAKALGLVVPPSILLRADEVIE